MRSIVLVAGSLLGALAAQGPPLVLHGKRCIDATSGELVVELAVAGEERVHSMLATPLVGDQFVLKSMTVDLGAGEVLDHGADPHVLRKLDGEELWRASGIAARGADSNWPRLADDRVIYALRAGGLLALDRRSGAEVWRRPKAPSDVVSAHGDLVIAADWEHRDAGKARLEAFARANGKPAFGVTLEHGVRKICGGPHGIAVVTDSVVLVHDRFGPELFRLELAATQVAPIASGWLVITADKLHAFDRRGEPLWQRDLPDSDVGGDLTALVVSPAGAPFVARTCSVADAGFAVAGYDPATGEPSWSHREPGLGVPHFGYAHRVEIMLRGDGLFVTSKGSAGTFVVELDAVGGARRGRHGLGR